MIVRALDYRSLLGARQSGASPPGRLYALLRPHRDRPRHLIVKDLEMPAMGGSEATRALQGDERTKDVPVIVLTGTARDSLLSDARAAGCAAVLRKPCMPEVLLEALRQVLRGEQVPSELALT